MAAGTSITTNLQQEIIFILTDTQSLCNILVQEAQQGDNGLLSPDNVTQINDNIAKFQAYLESIIPSPVV